MERAPGRGNQHQTKSHVEHGSRHERLDAAPAVDPLIVPHGHDELVVLSAIQHHSRCAATIAVDASTTDVAGMAQLVRNHCTNRHEQRRDSES